MYGVIKEGPPEPKEYQLMAFHICTACGTQYAESPQPPAHCVICEEERQYIPPRGQTWTTLDALQKDHTNTFHEYEKGIIAPLDDAAVTMVEALGGIDAIAISHPHFYTTMVEWARAFTARIHLHAADKQWIMRSDPAVELWDGETNTLWDGVTLVRCGGHFEGGTVLHWASGAGGRGVVCAGDILTVATDRKWLSFMRSYPNFIPLSARAVNKIGAALQPFAFETIYGHYFDRVIAENGQAVLEASVARYVAAVEGKRGYE
jgi:hypothetical protein